MAFTKKPEDIEREHPYPDEEDDHKDCNRPGRSVMAGPEVSPAATIGDRQPVVLDEYHDEEPLYMNQMEILEGVAKDVDLREQSSAA